MSIDKKNSGREIACCTSKQQLLTLYIVNGEGCVKIVTRRADLDVWVEIIGAMPALNIGGNEVLYLPMTGGQYLITVLVCLDQTAHTTLKSENVWAQGYRAGF